MSKMLLIFWCTLVICIVTGATTHMKQKNVQKEPIPHFPTVCKEQVQHHQSDCMKSNQAIKTSEIFLRTIRRTPRKFYA